MGWWVISELILLSISLLQSGGFMDMFGMMNDMIGNMVRLLFHPWHHLESSEEWGRVIEKGSSWVKKLNPESTGFRCLLSCLSAKQQQHSYEICS